jgi:type I restriction enzyme S subunit
MVEETATHKAVNERRVLPVGWHWITVRDIGPVTDGDWILNSDYASEGVRLLQVGDVGLGKFTNKSHRFISAHRARELGCTFLQPNDILISRMPDPIGRACLLPDLGYPAITAVDVSIWRPSADFADRRYLAYYLISSEWLAKVKSLASGATRARISRSNLENLAIPFPPLSEQKRIAAILREQMAAVERARAAAQAQLAAALQLPTAYLRQVFAGDEAHRWPKPRLADIVREAQGGFASGERDPDGVVQLRMNNVTTRGHFDWSSFIRVPASEGTIATYSLASGDVLFNNTNSTELVGKTALFEAYDEPVVFSNHFTRLRARADKLEPAFLASWLQYQWQRRLFADICNQWIGQSAVQRDKLLSLDMPLPPLPEQKRIAAILREQMAAVERARVIEEAQLDAIDKLPATLLRRAFNGEL